jgi:hypothetical protein
VSRDFLFTFGWFTLIKLNYRKLVKQSEIEWKAELAKVQQQESHEMPWHCPAVSHRHWHIAFLSFTSVSGLMSAEFARMRSPLFSLFICLKWNFSL